MIIVREEFQKMYIDKDIDYYCRESIFKNPKMWGRVETVEDNDKLLLLDYKKYSSTIWFDIQKILTSAKEKEKQEDYCKELNIKEISKSIYIIN